MRLGIMKFGKPKNRKIRQNIGWNALLATRSEFKLSLEYEFTPLYEQNGCRSLNLGFAFAWFFFIPFR